MGNDISGATRKRKRTLSSPTKAYQVKVALPRSRPVLVRSNSNPGCRVRVMTIDPKIEKKFLKMGSSRLPLHLALPPHICVPNLNALTTVVHKEIFDYLTGHEISALSQVNKRFHSVMKDGRVWRRLLDRDFPAVKPTRPNKKRRVSEPASVPEDDELANETSISLRSRPETFCVIERGIPVDHQKEYQLNYKQMQWSLRKQKQYQKLRKLYVY